MIINPYRFAGGGGGGNGLLDQYTGAAAAFSLRELSDAWAGQAVVNVYRVSDAATSDFTSDEITDGTMATWLGTTGGLIEKWYDQSGNGFDAIPAVGGTSKPRIYTGSTQTVTTVNGEPAIDMTLYGMKNAGTIAYNGGVSWYGVLDCGVISGSNRLWGDDITGAQGYTTFTTNGTSRLNDNDTGYEDIFTNSYATVQELSSFHFDSSTGDYEYARDGSNTTGNLATWSDVAIDSSNTANFGLGDAGNGGQPLAGFIQELIIYPDDQSANRTGIEGDINTHYSIY
jgi:hypothetical protein